MSQQYHDVQFSKSLSLPTAAVLRKFERQLAATLPDDYRAFFQKVNGGIPTPSEFALADPGYPGGRACIDVFYGIGSAPGRLDLAYEQLKIIERTDELPDGFLVIGHDPGGAPYFVCTEGETAGMIYFYDPSGFLAPGELPRLYVAARSFTDLFHRLAAGS